MNIGKRMGNKLNILALADDVVVMARSKQDLIDLTGTLIETTEYVGLKINDLKTKFMVVGRNQKEDNAYLQVADHKLITSLIWEYYYHAKIVGGMKFRID